jgi:hypothetical protein
MKWLVTGLGGTLAPVLAREAASQGVEAIGWKRDEVPPDDIVALAGLLRRPVAGIVHLDSNADQGHSFLDIVCALKRSFGRDG